MTKTRLTPMGVMVLALLREGDMHPYEMGSLLRARREDRLLAITNGTIYNTVSRLRDRGLIDEVGTDRAGNRPERTTYALTDTGDAAVVEWVRRELPRIDRPAEFRVALAEAHNLDVDEVVDLLTRRRDALLSEQQEHGTEIAQAMERGVPEQFLVDHERDAVLTEAELRWTDSFLARLEASAIPWGAAGFDNSDRYRAQRKAAQQ